ncbi:uncharacterized protein LOC144093755 [Amblyomma americanum]
MNAQQYNHKANSQRKMEIKSNRTALLCITWLTSGNKNSKRLGSFKFLRAQEVTGSICSHSGSSRTASASASEPVHRHYHLHDYFAGADPLPLVCLGKGGYHGNPGTLVLWPQSCTPTQKSLPCSPIVCTRLFMNDVLFAPVERRKPKLCAGSSRLRLGMPMSKPGGCPHSLRKAMQTVAILLAFVAST